MLDYVISKTLEFLEGMPKSVRKKKGQFFTSKETAEFMAQLFDFSNLSKKIEILDPGAGTGILSAALLDRAFSENLFSEIQLTCYENDLEVLPVLRKNLEYIQAHAPIKFGFVIVVNDYLISQAPEFEGKISEEDNLQKYDLIIGNPPYLRVMRDNPAAMAMPTVVHGAPNLYFLFAAMSLFNLKHEAEMVYIIPRSWTSGEYFKVFRKYFLRYGKIEQIHLFVSRDKVFSQEQVLQETIIIKIKKTAVRPQHVIISSSQTNNDYNNMTEIAVPYIKNSDKLAQLGFAITNHDKMPDIVLYTPDKDWIYFIEAVTSVGPMNPQRIIEIESMTKNVSAGKVFVTAFPNFDTYKKFSDQLAWETEVWLSDMPDHMIHLNGDKFLGPRK